MKFWRRRKERPKVKRIWVGITKDSPYSTNKEIARKIKYAYSGKF